MSKVLVPKSITIELTVEQFYDVYNAMHCYDSCERSSDFGQLLSDLQAIEERLDTVATLNEKLK